MTHQLTRLGQLEMYPEKFLSSGQQEELEILRATRIEYGILFDGYMIMIPDYSSIEWANFQSWVAENCNGRVCSVNYQDARIFVFEIENEAMAFKLRWS